MTARLDLTRALSTPIRELGESERSLFLDHLISLGDDDRYLRFGATLPDDAIARYVDAVDFSKDTLFGVFDDRLDLVAAGHFAPNASAADERSAEFGLSVGESARARGIGTALFLRAAARALNLRIGTLYMHCLSQNRAMIRIARKAGMEIQQSHGEADAHLTLPPGDLASAIEEGIQRQLAAFDFAIKRHLLATERSWKRFAPAG